MTIKTLDGHAVLCEDPGCGRPAVYLFTQTTPVSVCAALCEAHGLPFAQRCRIVLPHGLRTGQEHPVAIS